MLNKWWKVLSYPSLPSSKLPGGLSPWRGGPGCRRERTYFHSSSLVSAVAFVPLPGTTQARILTTSFLPPRPRSSNSAQLSPIPWAHHAEPLLVPWTPSILRQCFLQSKPLEGAIHFPCASLVAQMIKESTCTAGNPGSIPELRRSPAEGNSNPFQYPMDRRAWQSVVYGVAKSWTQLSDFFS